MHTGEMRQVRLLRGDAGETVQEPNLSSSFSTLEPEGHHLRPGGNQPAFHTEAFLTNLGDEPDQIFRCDCHAVHGSGAEQVDGVSGGSDRRTPTPVTPNHKENAVPVNKTIPLNEVWCPHPDVCGVQRSHQVGSTDQMLCSRKGDRAQAAGQNFGIVLTMDGVAERKQVLPVTNDPIANMQMVARIREAMIERMADVDPVGAAIRNATVAGVLGGLGDEFSDVIGQMHGLENDIDDGPQAWVQNIIDTLDAPTGTDDVFEAARAKVERVNDIAAALEDLDTQNRTSGDYSRDALAVGEILQDLVVVADDHDLDARRIAKHDEIRMTFGDRDR